MMPYLVRKLGKMDKVLNLRECDDIIKIFADVPTTEFRTTNGTLSTWYINEMSALDEAVLAIALTSSQITKMDFIIMDTIWLNENSLSYQQTYAGQELPIPELQDLHYDITGITIPKLTNCTKLYQDIAMRDPDAETYITRYTQGDIKKVIDKALDEGRLPIDRVPIHLRKSLGIS